jgi:hypothetical protein
MFARLCANTTLESARKSFSDTALRPGSVGSVARIFYGGGRSEMRRGMLASTARKRTA